jgi:pyruvate,water dikinase
MSAQHTYCVTVTAPSRKYNIFNCYGVFSRDSEIPSNIALAEQFAERFDGFSIGSNDLTQFVLAVDRDSELLAPLFDERNDAIKVTVEDLIKKAHKKGCKVGICGEAASNYPEFAQFLVKAGIDSISLSLARVVELIKRIAEVENQT